MRTTMWLTVMRSGLLCAILVEFTSSPGIKVEARSVRLRCRDHPTRSRCDNRGNPGKPSVCFARVFFGLIGIASIQRPYRLRSTTQPSGRMNGSPALIRLHVRLGPNFLSHAHCSIQEKKVRAATMSKSLTATSAIRRDKEEILETNRQPRSEMMKPRTPSGNVPCYKYK